MGSTWEAGGGGVLLARGWVVASQGMGDCRRSRTCSEPGIAKRLLWESDSGGPRLPGWPGCLPVSPNAAWPAALPGLPWPTQSDVAGGLGGTGSPKRAQA